MSILDYVKKSSRRVSDFYAGRPAYFWMATTNRSLLRAIRRALSELSDGRLLDAGAGRLAYRDLLREHCDTYESLDTADWHGEINHVQDVQRMSLPDESYDTAFCSQVIHHVPEPQSALNELARVLKPGARLILTAPHLSWLHNEPHDYYRFTRHGLRHMLERAGFEVESVRPAGGLICFLAFVPSTVALALTQPIPVLRGLAFWLNKFCVWTALCLDRVAGCARLFPTNYIVVARRRKRASEQE